MIELGLARITRLLKDTPTPWKAIHVAGTNGKGSVCAYASAMLHANNVKCGRFTSPHLIDRWDCITINEDIVRPSLFDEVETAVKAKARCEDIQASEFEILTATAFEIFNREGIEAAVVEVGLGGRHDATNVIEQPSVTVITQVGEDHQPMLGNSLEEIAHQKAGIMKPHVPCLVDGSNASSVLKVLEASAWKCQASSFLRIPHDLLPDTASEVHATLTSSKYEPHQIMNIKLAYEAVKLVAGEMKRPIDIRQVVESIKHTSWPGRLQMLNLERLMAHRHDVLLDGAHNPQSAEALGSYVDTHLRVSNSAVTWVIGISDGKNAKHVLCRILRPGDNLVAVEFGPVDGMPWVRPMYVDKIIEAAESFDMPGGKHKACRGLRESLHMAASIARGGPIVIAGSLYLISDILRLQRNLTWEEKCV
ncbi:MAG: hypothetical protein Q9164_000204 [Protoblastenia rupestris]